MLADSHGNVIHLGERDCSIQRRHQKLIEEAPGPHVDEEMRERIGKIATDAAARRRLPRRRHDRGHAGRRRVLLPRDEHPRPGRALRDRDGHRHRHRPRADPASPPARRSRSPRTTSSCAATRSSAGSTPRPRTRTSLPPPGPIESYIEPAGPGVRVDSGLEAGAEVTPLYDPMVAKLITWDVDREKATARMLRALGEYRIEPLTTLIPFHQAIMATEQWAKGETCRDLTEDKKWLKTLAPEAPPRARRGSRTRRRRPSAPTRSRSTAACTRVKVIGAALPAGGSGAAAGGAKRPKKRERKAGGGSAAPAGADAPLQGTVLKVAVEEGAEVEEGELDLRHRGDEDGERDHRPPRGQGDRAQRQGGRRPSTPATSRQDRRSRRRARRAAWRGRAGPRRCPARSCRAPPPAAQALALPRRVLRRGDALRGPRPGRPVRPDLLGACWTARAASSSSGPDAAARRRGRGRTRRSRRAAAPAGRPRS